MSKKAKMARKNFIARYSNASRQTVVCLLDVFYRWCEENDIDPIKDANRMMVEEFLRYCLNDRGNAPRSVNGKLQILRMYYEVALDDDLVRKNPCNLVRPIKGGPPPKRTWLNRFEVGQLISAAETSSRPRDLALIMLMVYMGLRSGEVCSLKLEDFSYEDGHHILNFIGKGNKYACVVVPPIVWRAIVRAAEDRTEGPLFLRADGRVTNRNVVYGWVKRLLRIAKIDKDITPHSLRRSYITGMLNAGMSLRDAQIGARHADIRTTMQVYDQGLPNLDSHPNHTVAAFFSRAA